MTLKEEGPAHGAAMAVADALGARGEAHVWWWRTPENTDPADLPLLDTEEFRRALSLPAERDAAAFVRSRAAARRALAGLFGLDPREIALGHGTRVPAAATAATVRRSSSSRPCGSRSA